MNLEAVCTNLLNQSQIGVGLFALILVTMLLAGAVAMVLLMAFLSHRQVEVEFDEDVRNYLYAM